MEEYIKQTAKYMKEIAVFSDDWDFDEDFFIKESRINIPDSIKRGVKRIITYAKKDEEIIGLSVIRCDPLEPEELYTIITGVDKAYRKKGLCRLMKSGLLLHIKKHYPEYSVITTSNDEKNSAMRNINKELVFKQLPAWKSYIFTTDSLNNNLKE